MSPGDTFQAIIALGTGPLGSTRSALVADLTTTPFPPGTRVIVGPGIRNLAGITRCLQESALTFDLVGHNGDVIDAANYAIERLLTVFKADTRVVDAFITEQIGDLLAADTRLELFTPCTPTSRTGPTKPTRPSSSTCNARACTKG